MTDIIEVPTIYRTYKQGVFELYKGTWGSYLRPTHDPDANIVELTEDHFKLFELRDDIHQIPSDLWSAWVQLCFYYSDKVNNNVEVSVRILRSESDSSKYRFLVPLQEVGKGSVRANNFQKSIDILTGEETTQYPPDGWIPIGSSHSHNTMEPFFSSTDDRYELTDPGLHIVVGSINQDKNEYSLQVSVTGNKRRFLIESREDEEKIVDLTPNDDTTYHSKVLDYVSTQFGSFFKEEKKSKVLEKVKSFEDRKTWKSWDFSKNKKWDWDKSLDSDPFFCSNDSKPGGSLKLWELESLIIEYIDEHEHDLEKMGLLLNTLDECTDTINAQIDEVKQIFDISN